MLSKSIDKKFILTILGIIILGILSLIVFNHTYNLVYYKTIEKQNAIEEQKQKTEINRKRWIAKITNTQEKQLDELVKIDKDYKLDADTLQVISKLSNEFNVNPDKVIEALGSIDLSYPKITRQRITLTLKKQKDKLYWLETKDASQHISWIKDRKEIITMCSLELALLQQAQKDSEIKEKLQSIRTQYLHKIYPKIYPWKGEEGTPKH